MNEMIVDFPGGARVDAHYGPYTIMTDQPAVGGGNGSAPTPFSLFLASIGTCAGIYVRDSAASAGCLRTESASFSAWRTTCAPG